MDSDNAMKWELDDIMGVCRTCLSRSFKINTLFDISKSFDICERIQFCSGLKITIEDSLPSSICSKCIKNLTIAYDFRMNCLESDRKLRQICSKLNFYNVDKLYSQGNDENFNVKLINNSSDGIGDSDIRDDVKNILTCEGMNKTCNENNPRNIIKSKNIDRLMYKNQSVSDLKFRDKKESDDHRSRVHKDDTWHSDKTSTEKSAYYYHKNCYFKNDMTMNEVKEKSLNKSNKRLGVKRGPYKKKTGNTNVDTTITGCDSASENVKRVRRKFKLNKKLCEKCDVRFENEEQFICHKRDVHKHVYLCEICGRVFYNKDARFSHMTSHESPKFNCDHCDYTTTRKQDLVKHIYVHNGIKRYQCEYCSLSFHTSSNLQHHLRRHTHGPHVCGVCDKRIFDRYSFKRHMDSHNGMTSTVQYVCQLCGSSFRRSSRLNQHMFKRHNVKTPPRRPGRRKIESRNI